MSQLIAMPAKLTAENGAKALLAGEFYEQVEETDSETGETHIRQVPVSWTNIKKIYQMIVDNRQELIG